MYREGAPLRRRRVKMSILYMQVTRRHRLRAQSIEQRHIGAARYAQIGIFQRLLLLRWFRYDFNAFRIEHADVVTIAVEHFHREHKMLTLIGIGNEQRLGRAILFAIQIELLHILIRTADANEGAQLSAMLTLTLLQHLLVTATPTAAE